MSELYQQLYRTDDWTAWQCTFSGPFLSLISHATQTVSVTAHYHWYVILSVRWLGAQSFFTLCCRVVQIHCWLWAFNVEEYEVSLDLIAGLGLGCVPSTDSAKWSITQYVESWWPNQDCVLVLSVRLGQQLLSPGLRSYFSIIFLILVVQKNIETQDKLHVFLSNVKLIYWYVN